MRTKVLPLTLVLALAGVALTGCTGDEDDPSSTPGATTSPTATASPAPAPGPTDDAGDGDQGGDGSGGGDAGTGQGDAGSTPRPVPDAEAEGWTDETAYQACVGHATETEGGEYTWSVRAGQTMVYQGGDRTIDVTGIFTGGDVGVANVVYRCVLGGTPGAPELTGQVVR